MKTTDEIAERARRLLPPCQAYAGEEIRIAIRLMEQNGSISMESQVFIVVFRKAGENPEWELKGVEAKTLSAGHG